MDPFFSSAGDIFFDLEIEIRTDAEADEFWSYIGNKENQRWTWYAIERKSGIILAWHNGRRTDESCACLMDKLSVFPIKYYYSSHILVLFGMVVACYAVIIMLKYYRKTLIFMLYL